jgi:hypothetical protein
MNHNTSDFLPSSRTIQATDGRANLLTILDSKPYPTETLIVLDSKPYLPDGKIRVHTYTPLPLTTSTSLALALDRQHKIRFQPTFGGSFRGAAASVKSNGVSLTNGTLVAGLHSPPVWAEAFPQGYDAARLKIKFYYYRNTSASSH